MDMGDRRLRFANYRWSSRKAVQLRKIVTWALSSWLALMMIVEPEPYASAPTVACDATSGRITRVVVSSAVYKADVPVSVYVPPCYDQTPAAFPVIYLLHGGNTDETQWPDLNVQPEADALIKGGAAPFIVVMPGGEYRAGLDYGAFVLDDLLPAIESQFRVKANSADRAIGGISLGGYWALKLAFSHPQLFAAVGAYSPVVDLGQPNDPLGLARSADGLQGLRIMLDVGDADALRAGTQSLAQLLQARDIQFSFTVKPGEHNRPYWRTRTADYLRFDVNAFEVSHCDGRFHLH